MSKKYLNRYVNNFMVRPSISEKGTIDQMDIVVSGMAGQKLMYK